MRQQKRESGVLGEEKGARITFCRQPVSLFFTLKKERSFESKCMVANYSSRPSQKYSSILKSLFLTCPKVVQKLGSKRSMV